MTRKSNYRPMPPYRVTTSEVTDKLPVVIASVEYLLTCKDLPQDATNHLILALTSLQAGLKTLTTLKAKEKENED